MPRFSVRDILVSVTLIAVGIALLRFITVNHWETLAELLIVLVIWFVGGALVGAGIGHLLNKRRRGIAAGLLLQFFILLMFGVLSVFH
jgi:hypothetical protein